MTWRYAARLARIGLLTCGLIAASFCGFAAVAQAQEAPPDGGLAAHAQIVANDINHRRAQHGLHPLALHPQLVQAAQLHAADMAANANYSHYGTDGSSVVTRVVRAGFSSRNASENWVSVNGPSEAAVWWMNSYVHRNNMLNGKWTHLGIGAQRDPRNGMTLFVAVFGRSGEGAQLAAASVTANPAAAAVQVAAQAPPGGMDYTIQPGDTLSGIAQRYGISWDHIASINGLGEQSVLQIGAQIRVPNPNDARPGVGGPVTGRAPELPDSYIEYVVQSGDTLSTIAQRYDTTWQELATLNGLSEFAVLELGRIVRIPSPGAILHNETQAQQAAPAPIRRHVVAPGETVISIAAQHGIGWGALLAANGLGEDAILQIGQELTLP